MKRILVSFLALALCAAAFPFLLAGAQEGSGRPNSSPRAEKTLDQLVRKYEKLRLNPAEAARGVRAGGRLHLATAEHSFELELRPNDMRAEDYRAEETGAGGVRTLLAGTPVRTYKGTVRGQAKAQARFTVDEETLEGMIITPAERYYVEPLGKYEPGADEADFVLYRKSDVIEDAAQTCGVTMDQAVSEAAKGVHQQLAVPTLTTQAAPAGMLYEAEIATEADYEYVTALGGSTAANAEILSIMNQVDGVYETELGISFKITHQHAWASNATSYPYTTAVGPDLLQKFTDHWNANFASVRRDVAHMWTGKDMVDPANDPGLIGIAWMGTVCVAPQLSYGISQRMTNAVYKSVLTAHELGHNFGTGHTGPSGCDNTIMNAYIGTRLTFCGASRNDIDSYVAAAPACMAQVCNPTFSPVGQSFAGAGGAGSIAVTAGASCAWTAKSNVSWVVVTSGASATGSKTVNYTVAANPAMTPRTGTLTVAGKTYNVTQFAAVGVKSLTLGNVNVPGGRKITATVALNLPAPAEGAVVALSDNLAATTIPASVTVPAGKTSAAFTVTTVITTTVQTGNVTASYNVGAASAPLTVRPAAFTAFKLSAASVPEGTGVTATFTLDGPAPPTGAVVTLSDTLPAAVTPASVTIPSGASTKTLVIPTTAVSASQTGVVTAAYAGVSKSAPLTVRPVGVAGIALTPDTVLGGNAVQGLVILEGKAPKNVSVTLTENLAGASLAPASLVVPAGASSAPFTVTTTAVTSQQTGVITAAAQGIAKSRALVISRPPAACSALSFADGKSFPASGSTYSMTTGDFNGDSRPDVVALSGMKVVVFMNTGAGSFAAPNYLTLTEHVHEVVVADFNLDGNQDIAAASNRKLAVLLGDGKGAFGAPTYVTLAQMLYSGRRMVVGDFNGDGRQDLTMTMLSGTLNVSFLPGDGLGGFGPAVNSRSGSDAGVDLATGDFNGDGKTDIARGRRTVKTADILLGKGTGLFNAPLAVNLTTTSNYVVPYQVAVGDFNKDGKQDLAFSQYFTVAVVLGDGKGFFGTPTFYTGAGYENELLVKDMNGDGNEDLVTLNAGPSISIFPGDGTGKFGAPVLVNTLGTPSDMAAADFNGDGKLDLVTSNSYSGGIVVLLSTCK